MQAEPVLAHPQGPTPRKRWVLFKRELRRTEVIVGLILLAIVTYLVIIPLVTIVYNTFTVGFNDRIAGASIGDATLHHWQRTLSSTALFRKPLMNSLMVATASSVLLVAIGTGMAWLLVRTDIPFKKAIGALTVLPYVLPSWAFALAWREVFQNQGVGRPPGLLEYWTGIQAPEWLTFGPVPITLVMAMHYFPFAYLMVSGALKTVDSQLEETAEILGASRWQVMRQVTLPLVTPSILGAAVLGFSQVMGTFGTPQLLGGPVRFTVLSTQIYSMLRVGRENQAFVLALVLVALSGLIIYVNNHFIGSRRSFVTIAGKGSKHTLVSLGRWRTVVGVTVLAVLLLIQVFPLALIGWSSIMQNQGDYSLSNITFDYWIGERDRMYGEPGLLRNPNVLMGAWNSIRIAVVGGVLCALLGTLIGYVVVRRRGTLLANVLDKVTFTPMLIPSIAFGAIYLSLFMVDRGPIPALYGTLFLLIITVIGKQMPYTTRTGISSMHQVAKELEEASIVIGASWLERFRRVIFPLVRTGFTSGFLIVLISTMRTLSLFILLITPATTVMTAVSFHYAEIGASQLSNALMTFLIVIILTLSGAVSLWEQASSKRRSKLV